MPDLIFADPRLAAIYDEIDTDRSDLDHYEAIVDEFGARSALDLGCGTGVLACRLAARKGLVDGGYLVFETRDPSARAWEEWTRERSFSISATVAGTVEHWVEVTNVALPSVSFVHTFRFVDRGGVVTSESTLRFRDRDEITAALEANGFTVHDVRGAPDRPGREFVFIARSTSGQPLSRQTSRWAAGDRPWGGTRSDESQHGKGAFKLRRGRCRRVRSYSSVVSWNRATLSAAAAISSNTVIRVAPNNLPASRPWFSSSSAISQRPHPSSTGVNGHNRFTRRTPPFKAVGGFSRVEVVDDVPEPEHPRCRFSAAHRLNSGFRLSQTTTR